MSEIYTAYYGIFEHYYNSHCGIVGRFSLSRSLKIDVVFHKRPWPKPNYILQLNIEIGGGGGGFNVCFFLIFKFFLFFFLFFFFYRKRV